MRTSHKVAIICGLAVLPGVAVVVLMSLGAQRPRGTGEVPDSRNPARPNVLPVLRLNGRSTSVIEFDFQNTSNQPLRYLHGNDDTIDAGGVSDLDILLYNDGRSVPHKLFVKNREDRPEMVRELKPGQHVRHLFRFPGLFVSVEPGTYELAARYDILAESEHTKEFGLTPMFFNRVIAIVEIAK